MEKVEFSWLGLRSAWCICALLSCWYVGSLYVLIPKHLRALERRNPRQIRARCIIALSSCSISYATLALLAKPSTGPHAAPTVVWIGLWWRWEAFAVMARAVILTMSIYLGPMIASTLMTLKFIHYKVTYTGEERKLASHKQRSFISLAVSSIVKQSLIEDDPWAAFRNFIVGPVSEEIVFRGIFFPLLVSNGSSILQIVLFSPMLFAVSHIHHLYDSLRHGSSITQALIGVSVQFAYTSIFGAYASFLFLRGGHLAAAIVAHTMCNFIGLPSFKFAVPPDASRLEPVSPMSILYPFATLLWVSYAVGITTFFLLLFPLTENLADRSHLWHVLQSRNL